MSTAQDI